MPFVITELCIKDGACAEVCPVTCIHTEPEAKQFYMDLRRQRFQMLDGEVNCYGCVGVVGHGAVGHGPGFGSRFRRAYGLRWHSGCVR